jgi:hypothetical protein
MQDFYTIYKHIYGLQEKHYQAIGYKAALRMITGIMQLVLRVKDRPACNYSSILFF